MRKVIFVKANERYQPKYCTRTLFLQDEQGRIEVVKRPSTSQAEEHLHLMAEAAGRLGDLFSKVIICGCSETEDGIRFDYIPHRTDWLQELEKEAGNPEGFLKKWKEYLSLISPQTSVRFTDTEAFQRVFGAGEAFEGEAAFPFCAWDITPSNLLITEAGENVLIDYEWFFDFPVPVRLVQYHCVKVTLDSHPEMLRKMERSILLRELGFSDREKALEQAEASFFHHLYDGGTNCAGEPFDLIYKKGETNIYQSQAACAMLENQNQQLRAEMDMLRAERKALIENHQKMSEEMSRLSAEFTQAKQTEAVLAAQNGSLSAELKKTQDQLLLAWNSKSWKITAPLRFLNRMKSEGKNPLTEGWKKVAARTWAKGDGADPAQKNDWMPHYRKAYDHRSSTLSGKNPKRLVIMYFYDKDGVADEASLLLARSVSATADRTVAVVGGLLNEEGREAFSQIFDQVYFKENEGFDFWGYREGLVREGWKNLGQYDEVILCNFTILGPVCPLDGLYRKMEEADCDFWGITSHPGMEFDPFQCNPYGCVPEHVQSFFLAFRQHMVRSSIFRKFWLSLPKLPTYDQAVGLAETVLTRYFGDAGFVWTTFVDREAYYPLTDNPMITMPMELIRDQGCPFFKRRVFFQDYDYYISYTCGQTARQLFDYLETEKLYDMDILWKHLLRTCHMSDLNEKLHLTKYLPTEVFAKAHPALTTAAVIHLYDLSMLGEILEYCRSFPAETVFYISTTDENKKRAIEEAFAALPNHREVIAGKNRGRDISGLLVLFRDKVQKYDLVCVTHDKQTSHLKPLTVGKGFARAGYTNILESREYVSQIIQCFANEPRLGLLFAPMSYHADFSSQPGHEWGENYENTARLAEELRLNCPMDQRHPPFAPYGSNFWFRTRAMKPLLEKKWTYEDFPEEPLKLLDGTILHAVERIYPYCAQSEGYYSSTVMTEDYARLDMSTLFTYAEGWANMMAAKGVVGRFVDVRNVMAQKLKEAGS